MADDNNQSADIATDSIITELRRTNALLERLNQTADSLLAAYDAKSPKLGEPSLEQLIEIARSIAHAHGDDHPLHSIIANTEFFLRTPSALSRDKTLPGIEDLLRRHCGFPPKRQIS